MKINWETIEHICISIAIVGAAITYIWKGIKFAKKPADDVASKLDNDNQRINKLMKDFDYIDAAIGVLLRSELAILGHLQTDNNTGRMAAAEKEIQEFLINN